MTENFDEDLTFKNRIILREATLKKLTSKYLDLMSKFNTLTRNEMAQLIKEILNEIEMIDISILKAENLEKIKEIDTYFRRTSSKKINQNMSEIKNEISKLTIKMMDARNDKEYKIHCEEIAKIVNSYSTQESMLENINHLEDEINKIKNSEINIMHKIEGQSKKLSLLVKLVNDLKSNFETEIHDL